MLISDEYRTLNQQLHSDRKDYGSYGSKWANHVLTLAQGMNTESVLDYGCGKGTLGANMPFDIQQYDPAIEKHSGRPQPADLVVCTDVLEHIEPSCLDDVLNDLWSLCNKGVFLVIHNGPAAKKLADGRNAHLIQENEIFWLGALLPRFELITFSANIGKKHSNERPVLEYLVAGVKRPGFSIEKPDTTEGTS